MGKKLTLEIVKERLKDINPMVEIIDDVYKGSKEKMKCRCLKEGCGHEFETTWDSLSGGHGCHKCAGRPTLSIDIIKHRVKEVSPEITILSTEYTNRKSKILCKCNKPECSYEWETSSESLLIGNKCPMCSGVAKLDIETVVKRTLEINPDMEILDKEYRGNKSKLKIRCLKDGHIFYSSWASIRRGRKCPKCSKKMRLNIDIVKENLSKISPEIEIISNEYKNNATKIKCRCKNGGHVWESTWRDLQMGYGCSTCNSGFLSIKRAERNKDSWVEQSGELYFIRCYSDDENFLKVGVTRKTIEQRFSGANLPYSYEIIDSIEDNFYNIVKLEKKLLGEIDKFLNNYTPNIKFDGYTECFDISGLKYVKEFLAKKKVGED